MSTQKHHWNAVHFSALLSTTMLFSIPAAAQTAATIPHESIERSIISLAPSAQPHAAPIPGEPSFENTPANFHAFASARAGEDASIETLKLNFSDSTTLGKIESQSKDFVVEPSGTCHEGNTYSTGQRCASRRRARALARAKSRFSTPRPPCPSH
ncbi:MAG TPA: hypothetical protein VF742_12260 [Terracidiphilus sp.]